MTIAVATSPERLAGLADPRRSLKVGGITPYSTQDYPGLPAAIVFVQGCPWQCSYCHNPHLQLQLPKAPLAWPRVLQLLEQRSGVIQAVLFSGGEPTGDPTLPEAMRNVRELGLRVGMHTAGAYPERLAAVLPMLDWVALDIKAPFARYEKVTGVHDSGATVRASAQLIVDAGIAHEFRTTVHPSLLDEDDLSELAADLSALGVQNLTLQAFRPQGCRNKALKSAGTLDYPSPGLLRVLENMFTRFCYQPV